MRRTIAQSGLVFASVLLLMAVAGCGGSGKTVATPEPPEPPEPTPVAITGLPPGHSLEAGMLAAGASRVAHDADGMRTTVTCPAGGAACNIMVADDGSATSTGGTPTVATIEYSTISLPSGHSLRVSELRAGESLTVADASGMRTTVTCPAGGAACNIIAVTANGAESTGGTPTVVTYAAVALPAGHTLQTGTIAAGADPVVVVQNANGMRTTVMCAAGGAACKVTRTPDGVEVTGGMLNVDTFAVYAITLPADHSLQRGSIPAGESRVVHDANRMRTVVTCPAGGAACNIITVTANGAESRGGEADVDTFGYTPIELPEGHSLRAGTLQPGTMLTVHGADAAERTEVVCPAGGAACVVTLTEDGAESTGGAIEKVTYGRLTSLPAGHTLTSGTIPAGESRSMDIAGMRTVVTCPADGEACVITVAADKSVESTGGTPTVMTTTIMTPITLPDGHALAAGTIPAGESRTLTGGGRTTVVTCPAGGEACVIAVADGATTYANTGGTPTVVTTVDMTPITLPDGYSLTAQTIEAGESVNIDVGGRRVTVTCPADGADCVIAVGDDGSATYAATGGTPTVGSVETLTMPITTLPTGAMLAAGTIEAGESRTVRGANGERAVVTCPADGEDCVITAGEDGAVAYALTGGTPTVATTTIVDQMVWQANNGPDGDSNGAHAVGLGKRLITGAGGITLNTIFTADPTEGAESNVQSTVAATVTPSMEWTGGAPELKLTLQSTAFTGLGDTTGRDPDPGELKDDSGSMAPALGTGWRQDSLSGSFLGRTMRATIYTNADAPDGYTAGTPRRSVATGLDLVGESALITAFGDTAPTENVEFEIPSSSIGTDVKVTIPSGSFTALRSGSSQAIITGVTVSYTDAEGEMQEGVAVTMSCVSDTCRGITGSNPRLVGAWDIAIPAVAAIAGTQDLYYVTFGSWLVLPETPSLTDQYNLGVFADGSVASRFNRGQMDNDVGIKDFEGRAAGLYMTGQYSGRGGSRALASAEVDSFTADVELSADFGADAASFTGVSGTVENFKGSDDSSLGWEMSLEDTGDDGGVLHIGDTVLETPVGQSLTGKWGVEFYWDITEAVPGGRLHTGAGTFSASTEADVDNALHVIGAFSTTRQTP